MAMRPKARLQRLSSMSWVGFVVFGAVFIKLLLTDTSTGNDNGLLFEMKLFSGCMGVTSLLLALFCKSLADRDPAASHKLSSLLTQYFLVVIMPHLGKFFYKRFLKSTKNVASSQEKFLMKLIKANVETDYGKAHGFAEINSLEEFRAKHPLTTYNDIEPYIDRICNINRNALTKSDPMFMTRTSGTTGKYKKIPLTGDAKKSSLALLPLLMYMPKLKGVQANLQKQFSLIVQPRVDTTATGLKVAPLSYFFYRYSASFSSPKASSEISNEHSAYYIHGLFALCERDIGSFMVGFSYQCYAFFIFLENNLESLSNDIQNGTIRDGLDLEAHVYQALRDAMQPDTIRATEVVNEFQKGKIGLAKRLWPGLCSCRTVSTGTMKIYTKHLLDTYLKDVPMVSSMFGGSEGVYALGLTGDNFDTRYTLAHQLGFFEFLPEENIADQDAKEKLVLAHLVQPGCKYELVVSNQNGLYRYRTGDVVRVTSLFNECPVLEVLYRTGHVINVLGERTTEDLVYQALVKASDDLDCDLVDYTVCEDVYFYGISALREMARKYVLFVEVDKKLEQKDLEKFDASLCEVSDPYRTNRTSRKLMDPMQVTQVKPDTFIKLQNQMTKGVPNPQFKIPRALRIKEHLDFLMDNKW